MARRQVIVQLDDELVARLDREARRLGISRSELLRRGARVLLNAADDIQAERIHAESYRRMPQDEDWVEAATRLATETLEPW